MFTAIALEEDINLHQKYFRISLLACGHNFCRRAETIWRKSSKSSHPIIYILVAKDVKKWNRKPVLKAKGKLKTVEENSVANPQRGRLEAVVEYLEFWGQKILWRGPHQLSRFSKFSAELSSGSTTTKSRTPPNCHRRRRRRALQASEYKRHPVKHHQKSRILLGPPAPQKPIPATLWMPLVKV